MAAEGGCIDFMFLAPPPYPAAESATDLLLVCVLRIFIGSERLVFQNIKSTVASSP